MNHRISIERSVLRAGSNDSEAGRLAVVRAALQRHFGDRLVDVAPFREGVDCFVDLVRIENHAPAVVRTAKVERLQTRYDGLVDWGEVLVREVTAVDLMAQAGVPMPRLFAWQRAQPDSDERSWMLLQLVENTRLESLLPLTQRHLGDIARTIHNITPEGLAREVLTPWHDWESWIVDRILQRVEAARAYVALPDLAAIRPRLIQAVAGRGEQANRLLHLDLRAPNLAISNGRIVAVFDYSNAICGDPYLELARIQQCGLLTHEFQAGYGLTTAELAAHERLLQVYSLDLTALLVVVAREEFEDLALHREMAARTVTTLRLFS